MLRQEIFSLPWLILSVFFIFFNYIYLFLRIFKKKHISFIPLLGGFFGLVFCLVNPHFRYFFLIPLLIDPGTLEMILYMTGIYKPAKRKTDRK